jgi:aryl-alcohol dehydrogenase-like predicted oxidoreductase
MSGMIRETEGSGLERRPLGRTGEKLSIIGLGGVVVDSVTSKDAADVVSEAVDHGINYFDVAPSYGNAEEMLGPALEPYRKKSFLACKTTQRDRENSRMELERSLKRLRTNHLDLYQLHSVTTLADVKKIFGPDGAMETFQAARKEGKIRFLGFSAHSVEAAMELMDLFDFDSILFPVNFATWHAGNFGPQVLERAADKGMGILALKAMANRPWQKTNQKRRADFPKCWYDPLDKPEEAELALRFTLSHAITAALPPGDPSLFRLGMKLASNFRPITDAEAKKLKAQALAGEPLFRYPSDEA